MSDNASSIAPPPTDQPIQETAARGIPASNIARAILKNSAAQVGGRVGVALLRLVIAGIILRAYGKDLFGEYSLLFGILTIADWLVDFGTTDVFVREFCRKPEDGAKLLRTLTAAKFLQAPAAFVALAVILFALRYPSQVVEAGMVGGLNLFFFAGVLVYRVAFRSTLTTEREALAEFLSVIVMVPLIFAVSRVGGGLVALLGCHVISRILYFAACYVLGRRQFVLSTVGATRAEVLDGLRSSAAIGAIGFMVGGYETLDVIILSKTASLSDLAYFSGAQRLVWPMLLILGAVAGTFYPVYSSLWIHDRAGFYRTCQHALDTIIVLAGLALCPVLAGSVFFMGLLGPSMIAGASALQWLGLLCFIKAITSTLGPVLYVVNAQKSVLRFIGFALAAKAIAITLLAPRYGYMGAIAGALGVEVVCSAIPTVYLVRRLTGFKANWGVALKVVGIISICVAIPYFTLKHGGFAAAAVAALLYVPLALATGTVRIRDVMQLMERRPA